VRTVGSETETRVLVVDDDDEVRSVLRIFLEQEGFTIVAAVGRGTEALRQLRHTRVDVVVLDLALAGVDGLEVAPLLLEHDSTLPIVVFSGFLHPSVLARAEAVGIRACIDKNRIAELSTALRQHARHPAPDAQAP
jgi:CheY-like chemotaxis protein